MKLSPPELENLIYEETSGFLNEQRHGGDETLPMRKKQKRGFWGSFLDHWVYPFTRSPQSERDIYMWVLMLVGLRYRKGVVKAGSPAGGWKIFNIKTGLRKASAQLSTTVTKARKALEAEFGVGSPQAKVVKNLEAPIMAMRGEFEQLANGNRFAGDVKKYPIVGVRKVQAKMNEKQFLKLREEMAKKIETRKDTVEGAMTRIDQLKKDLEAAGDAGGWGRRTPKYKALDISHKELGQLKLNLDLFQGRVAHAYNPFSLQIDAVVLASKGNRSVSYGSIWAPFVRGAEWFARAEGHRPGFKLVPRPLTQRWKDAPTKWGKVKSVLDFKPRDPRTLALDRAYVAKQRNVFGRSYDAMMHPKFSPLGIVLALASPIAFIGVFGRKALEITASALRFFGADKYYVDLLLTLSKKAGGLGGMILAYMQWGASMKKAIEESQMSRRAIAKPETWLCGPKEPSCKSREKATLKIFTMGLSVWFMEHVAKKEGYLEKFEKDFSAFMFELTTLCMAKAMLDSGRDYEPSKERVLNMLIDIRKQLNILQNTVRLEDPLAGFEETKANFIKSYEDYGLSSRMELAADEAAAVDPDRSKRQKIWQCIRG